MNAIVPYEISGQSVTQIRIFSGTVSSTGRYRRHRYPGDGVFLLNSMNQAAVLNQDNSLNGPSNPCTVGSIIQIFATGEGVTTPPSVTGAIAGSATNLTQPQVSVSIGGIQATVTYAGSAPGEVAGLLQVNAMVPQGVAPGNSVSVVVTVGTANSRPGPTIAVK